MDTRPQQFVVTTDFPTLKNNGVAQGTIVIPGSLVIPAGGTADGALDFTVGSIGSLSRGRIASSKNFGDWYTGQGIRFPRNSGGNLYDVFAFIWRPSAGVTRFQVVIHNPYAFALTTEAGDDTIYFYSNQFVAPYS